MDANTGVGAAIAASANAIGLPGDYRAFLEAKVPVAQACGFDCALDEVPATLKDGRPLRDHQRHIIAWAVRRGRAALFEAFGLGKSIQQILIVDMILDKVEAQLSDDDRDFMRGRPNMGLIVAPLGVRREFIRDAELLGKRLHFVKSDAEIAAIGDDCGLYLTNYESVRDGKINVSRFTAVSLDEASVLRSYGSKRRCACWSPRGCRPPTYWKSRKRLTPPPRDRPALRGRRGIARGSGITLVT